MVKSRIDLLHQSWLDVHKTGDWSFEENWDVSSAPTAERMPLTTVVYSTSTGRL
jgi:hypothetical protein